MPIIKQLKQHKLLFDTHVWIWTLIGDERLSFSFRNALNKNFAEENILISPISIWELGMLVNKKRLELEIDVLEWTEKALNQKGVRLSPITARIAIQSTRLPGHVHGDPADRILISTAHEENSVLVTCDEKILEYGKDQYISVYNPID